MGLGDERGTRAERGRQHHASSRSSLPGAGQGRRSSSSSILDPAMNAEFLQLVAKHAPLELDLLSIPVYTSQPLDEVQPPAAGKQSSRDHAHTASTEHNTRRLTGGSSASHGQLGHSRHPTYHVKSETSQQTVFVKSAAASRASVQPNPKLLVNPVEEERSRARHRASAAASIAERTRHEAQLHRQAQAKALQHEAELLVNVVSQVAPATEEHIRPVIAHAAIKPASRSQGGGSAGGQHRSAAATASRGATLSTGGSHQHDAKPSSTADEVHDTKPPATATATATSTRPGTAQVAASISAELAIAAPAAGSIRPASAGSQRKAYPRPWAANMVKPGTQPAVVAPVAAPGPDRKLDADVAGLAQPPQEPSTVLEPPQQGVTGAQVAARLHRVDPETHAHLLEYMHRKRADMKQKLRDEAERAKEAQLRPLVHRREASAQARLDARRHAAALEHQPMVHVRRAWVEPDPHQHVSIPTTTTKRCALSAKRAHPLYNTDSEPDIDAVSVIAQPNRTKHGLKHDARGARLRILASKHELEEAFLERDENGSPRVIRVRDPVRAKSASRSPPPVSRAALLAKESTVVMRGSSPSKPVDVRYVDVLTRRTAAWEYAEKLRQSQLEQLRQQQQDARRRLRMLRKVQRKKASSSTAKGNGYPAGTAALAAALFPRSGMSSKVHQPEKKRRPGATETYGSHTTMHTTKATNYSGYCSSRLVARGGAAAARHRAAAGHALDVMFEPVKQQQRQAQQEQQGGDGGPTDEAVAALKELVLQLSNRIAGLQEEAQQERERLSGGPGAAWEAPQHAQHDTTMTWEAQPGGGRGVSMAAEFDQQQWAMPVGEQQHAGMRPAAAAGPHGYSHHTDVNSASFHEHGHQPHGHSNHSHHHHQQSDHHHHHHHQQSHHQQHQQQSHVPRHVQGMSHAGHPGAPLRRPEVPSGAAATSSHPAQHVGHHEHGSDDDGRGSPDYLNSSMKKPRLSLEDQVASLPAPPRPSCVPAIRVPTSTRHTVPDPTVPFPAWATSAEATVTSGVDAAREGSSDEEMRQHRRSSQLIPAHELASHHQSPKGHRHHHHHQQQQHASAQPTFSPSSSHHYHSSSSSSGDDDDDDGHHGHVYGIEDLQTMAMDHDDAHDHSLSEDHDPASRSYDGGQGNNPSQPEHHHHQQLHRQQHGMGQDHRQPGHDRDHIGQIRDMRDSLSLAGSDSGPLSPDSDLISRHRQHTRHWADAATCEGVVQKHEQQAQDGLKVGLAAKALQVAVREEQAVQAGARALSASLKRSAADVDSDSETGFSFPNNNPVDPLSIVNIAARQLLPRRPISISIPPATTGGGGGGGATGNPTNYGTPGASSAHPTSHPLALGYQPTTGHTSAITTTSSTTATQAGVQVEGHHPAQQAGVWGAAGPAAPAAVGTVGALVPSDMIAGLPPYLVTYVPGMFIQPQDGTFSNERPPGQILVQIPTPTTHQDTRHSSPSPPRLAHAAYGASAANQGAEMVGDAVSSPPLAPTIPGVVQGVQGGGALLQPRDNRPRVSPAELQSQLLMHMRRLDEMERVDAELSQLEQARALAAVQQEAHHIATTLDQTLAAQQQVASTKAMAEQHEHRLKSIADSMRQELRSESLNQLKDVAAMFVQHIKCSRVAHAEVQTSILDPAPGLPTIMDAAVGTSPSNSMNNTSRQGPSSSSHLVTGSKGGAHKPGAAKRAAGVGGGSSLNAELTAAVASRQHGTSSSSGELYSDAFESATKSGEQLLWPEGRGVHEDSIADELLPAVHPQSHASRAADSSMSDVPDHTLAQSVSGLNTSGKLGASASNTYSTDTAIEDSTVMTGTASLGGVVKPISRLANVTNTVLHTVPMGSASIVSESQIGSQSLGQTLSGSGVVDEVGLGGFGGSGGGWQHGGVGGGVSPAGRLGLSQASPAGTHRGDPSPATPLTAIRASPAGELCVPEPELLEMMEQVEANSQAELSRLQAKKAAVEAAAMQELQQLASQMRQAGTPQQRVNLMGSELKIKLKLNMEISSIERQILALKDDMTLKKVQMHQLQRLVVTLNTPGSAGGGGRTGSARTTPGATAAGRGGGGDGGRHAQVTPTRSVAVHPGGRSVQAAGSGMSVDGYSEDFEPASSMHIGVEGSSMQEVPDEALVAGGSRRLGASDVSDPFRSDDHRQRQQQQQAQGGPRTTSDSGSSELEQQRQQLEAELRRKQAQLKAQQKKQAIAQLQAQVADVNRQLAKVAAMPPTGSAAAAGGATRGGGVSTHKAVSAPAAGSSPSDASAVPTDSGSAQSISDSASQIASETYSIEDELESRDSTQKPPPRNRTAVAAGAHGGVGVRQAGHTHHGVSGDSLEEAAQQVQRLQQEVHRKQREARRSQLAAQQLALQQQLQVADQQLASAHATMQSRDAPGNHHPTTNTNRHKPAHHSSTITESIAYDESFGAGRGGVRGVTQKRSSDSDDDAAETVADSLQGDTRHASVVGTSSDAVSVDVSVTRNGAAETASGSGHTGSSIQYSQAFTADHTRGSGSRDDDDDSGDEPEDLLAGVHDADDLTAFEIEIPDEQLIATDHAAAAGASALRSHPLTGRDSRSLGGSTTSSTTAEIEHDGSTALQHSAPGSPPESVEDSAVGQAGRGRLGSSSGDSVASDEQGAAAGSSPASSVDTGGVAAGRGLPGRQGGHDDDDSGGDSDSSGSGVREILMDIDDLQAMDDIPTEVEEVQPAPGSEESDTYTMSHSHSISHSHSTKRSSSQGGTPQAAAAAAGITRDSGSRDSGSQTGSASQRSSSSTGGGHEPRGMTVGAVSSRSDGGGSGGGGGGEHPVTGSSSGSESSKSSCRSGGGQGASQGGVSPGMSYSRSLEVPSDELTVSAAVRLPDHHQEEEEEEGLRVATDKAAQGSLGYTADFDTPASSTTLHSSHLSTRPAPKPVVASSITGEVLLDASDLLDSLAISEDELLAAAQADTYSQSFQGVLSGTDQPPTNPAAGTATRSSASRSSGGVSEAGHKEAAVQGIGKGVQGTEEKSDEYATEFDAGSDAGSDDDNDVVKAQAQFNIRTGGSSTGSDAAASSGGQQEHSDSETDLAQYQVQGITNSDDEGDQGHISSKPAAAAVTNKAGLSKVAPLHDSHASTEIDIEDDVQAAGVGSQEGEEELMAFPLAGTTSGVQGVQGDNGSPRGSLHARHGPETDAAQPAVRPTGVDEVQQEGGNVPLSAAGVGRDSGEVRRSGSGRHEDSDGTESSVSVSDYSMSFDGADVMVDALPESPSKLVQPRAEQQQQEQEQEDNEGDEAEGLADGLTTKIWDHTLADSIEAIVSAAGGPTALSPSKLPPTASLQSARATHQAAAESAAAGQQPVIDLTAHEELEEVAPAASSSAAAKQLGGIPGLTNRTLKRNDSDGSEASDGFDSVGITFTEDDLGWGDDDDLGPVDFNLGGYLVPEVDQEVMRREAAAAAAPKVDMSPQAVRGYLGQVLSLRAKEHGAWPQMLLSGHEPLVLEGFLELERSLPDASEAQHITNKLLYDAANEALINIYKSTNRVQQPWWAGANKVPRPLPPGDQLVSDVQQQVQSWLDCKAGYDAELDKLLTQEAVEDERSWGLLKNEMAAGVKLDVADCLWEDLLGDTANILRELEINTVH